MTAETRRAVATLRELTPSFESTFTADEVEADWREGVLFNDSVRFLVDRLTFQGFSNEAAHDAAGIFLLDEYPIDE